MANLAITFEYQEVLLEKGAVRPLVELLSSESNTAQERALQASDTRPTPI